MCIRDRRIKADNGDDYYVDDNDCIMPRTNYTSDLIIASGDISRWYAINYISPLGKAIMQNDLWKNLIEQIHILPDHGVELVPRIGDHIVFIGRLPDGKNRQQHEEEIAEFIDKKMTRLEKFYKYGLSQVGWNKYSYVNIEFDNQIICRKKKEIAAKPEQETTTEQAVTETPPTEPEEGPAEGSAIATATAAKTNGKPEKTEKAADKAEKTQSKPAKAEKTQSKTAKTEKTQSKPAKAEKTQSKPAKAEKVSGKAAAKGSSKSSGKTQSKKSSN